MTTSQIDNKTTVNLRLTAIIPIIAGIIGSAMFILNWKSDHNNRIQVLETQIVEYNIKSIPTMSQKVDFMYEDIKEIKALLTKS